MPFALVIIGLLMIVTGVQNTHAQFGAQLVKDFSNSGTCNPIKGQAQGCGFIWWIAAIGAVGMLGYSDTFKSFSRAFLALIVLAMLIANRGFFAKLEAALRAAPTAPQAAAEAQSSGSGAPTAANENTASTAKTAATLAEYLPLLLA